jgi:hypothetical protein
LNLQPNKNKFKIKHQKLIKLLILIANNKEKPNKMQNKQLKTQNNKVNNQMKITMNKIHKEKMRMPIANKTHKNYNYEKNVYFYLIYC